MGKVLWRGVTVDQRTGYMLDELALLTPDLPYLRPTQGSYNTSVDASAGTHAGGGAVDLSAGNLTDGHLTETVRVMRSIGFAAWWRHSWEGPWIDHIHAIAIGCPDLSPAAADQVDDYKAGRNGLANNAADTGPDVPYTTWETYLEGKQDMYEDVWRRDGKMRAPKGWRTDKNRHWWPESVLERIGDVVSQLFRHVWFTDGEIAAPDGYPHKDTNPHWHPQRFLREMVDSARYHIEPDVSRTLELVEAIADSHLGASADEIKAHIDKRHAETAARLEGIAATLDQHADGTLDANDVVARIGELLTR